MNKLYSNVMIDLETMGKGPNAAIIAIGAVAFDIDTGEIGPEFYQPVSLESAVREGGVIDADTVMWWMQQSDEARAEFSKIKIDINDALMSLDDWFAMETNGDVFVWGNGAPFDNVILRSAFERSDLPPPWKWWNDRCYRTIKALHPHIALERIGTHHNALDDARSQAQHLIAMLAGAPA